MESEKLISHSILISTESSLIGTNSEDIINDRLNPSPPQSHLDSSLGSLAGFYFYSFAAEVSDIVDQALMI